MKLFKGWSREESEILRKALIKFGIGNWAKIIESQCLPGKTNAQMNLQLQRMLGQQSTAGMSIYTLHFDLILVCHAIITKDACFCTEFNGLHIDPLVIGEKNSKIQGPTVKRKNNCIVNTGGMHVITCHKYTSNYERLLI